MKGCNPETLTLSLSTVSDLTFSPFLFYFRFPASAVVKKKKTIQAYGKKANWVTFMLVQNKSSQY